MHRMGKETLGAQKQLQKYCHWDWRDGVICMTGTLIDDCNIFKKYSLGRQGGEIVPSAEECLKCVGLL